MAATGKTPILLYGSTTSTNTPTAGNLTNSSDGCEIAINVADKNLFFKDSTNTVNTVPIRQSSASSNGWLSSTDWSTFNSKQPAGTYVTSVTGTAPVVSSGGTTPAISMAAANGSTNGYLTSTDWSTFNGKAPAFTYTTGYIPFGQGTTTPTQSSNLFWDNSNVRLGVGTSSPAKTLDVNGAANINGALTIAGNFLVPSGCTIYASTGDVYARAGTSGNLYLGANGSNSLATLFASGGVSIGNTTDPGAKNLYVSGNVLINGSANTDSAYFVINGGTANNSTFSTAVSGAFNQIIFRNPNGVVGTIQTNGTATAYNTASDYRLKKNPINLESSGEFIDALQPKTWEWVTDGTKGVGFIAHEVQAVSPLTVTGEKDAVNDKGEPVMQSMEYGSAEFIANIIAELKSLRKRVAELEAKGA